MRTRWGTGPTTRMIGVAPRGVHRGLRAAALVGIVLFGCVGGLAATLGASAAGASPSAGPEAVPARATPPAGAAPSAGVAARGRPAAALRARQALLQAHLTAPDGAQGDAFGWAVAISGDTALVGAPSRTTAGLEIAGAVYVFVRSGGSWTLQATLTPGDPSANAFFGDSVAISGDTALVGAPQLDVAGNKEAGAVYLFVRSGGAWTQQAKLTAFDGAPNDKFGDAVALDGDIAMVGAPFRRSQAGGKVDGGAYVYARSSGSWTMQQRLNAPDAAYYYFGTSIALSGSTALISATQSGGADDYAPGAVWVFVRTGMLPTRAPWVQQAVLTASDGAGGDKFGTSVALSGETALVGAPYNNTSAASQAGAVYSYVRTGTSWAQQARITAADGAVYDHFGSSVTLSGETAVIGALRRQVADLEAAGAAYTFVRSGTNWIAQQTLTASDAAPFDTFGSAVASSGQTALVGAPSSRFVGGRPGAAYVFSTAPSITSFLPAAGPVGTQVTITGSGFAAMTTVTFNGAASVNYTNGDSQITATVPPGATSGPIVVTTPAGTATSATSFTVIPAPSITSFAPASGPVGKGVVITGSGLSGATSVAFSGAGTAVFIVNGDSQITTTVPAGSISGPIAVTTPGGTATSAGSFTVIPRPVIAKIHPASAKRGAMVAISGAAFGATLGTSSVKFGTVKCLKYAVWSDTLIKVRVPWTAKLGAVGVTVTTEGGTSKAKKFVVATM